MNRERGGALDAREEPACAGPGVSAAWPSRGRAGCPSVCLSSSLSLSPTAAFPPLTWRRRRRWKERSPLCSTETPGSLCPAVYLLSLNLGCVQTTVGAHCSYTPVGPDSGGSHHLEAFGQSPPPLKCKLDPPRIHTHRLFWGGKGGREDTCTASVSTSPCQGTRYGVPRKRLTCGGLCVF